jgi:hypothetical protein
MAREKSHGNYTNENPVRKCSQFKRITGCVHESKFEDEVTFTTITTTTSTTKIESSM